MSEQLKFLHERLKYLNRNLDEIVSSGDYIWYKNHEDKKEYYFAHLKTNLGIAYKIKQIEQGLKSQIENIEGEIECINEQILVLKRGSNYELSN